ncbi:hypothetical protein J2M53_15050 [Arthrobacter sp. zg-ZUI100]|uniref:hypothetical protein n=1 Tax=Arthrobacter jiangjiafuii TaxID=2817475 RepID=UPI001AEE03AA|nr:hypothetical protein [Arthrobacter jiangjiafuii]MBP3037561.1 hypothetical protein [Arthrobacter jiangjiafuii]
MSRLTVGNIFKVAVAVFFFPFLPLLVLMIGVRRKNWKVTLEGAVYIALLIGAFAVPSDSAFFLTAGFIGLGTIPVSAIRSYLLRDLWLHRRVRGRQHQVMTPHPATTQPAQPARYAPPSGAPTEGPAQGLSQALVWTATLAKQNKNRLPTDSYISVLETCQTLDAVIDAETRQPMGDPQFEYELTATVREYLPAVLRNYLAIPPGMVDTRQVNGRTPNEELVEQLQLLSRQAETLHSSRHRHTSAELSNMGNFLRERFRNNQGGPLDLGK